MFNLIKYEFRKARTWLLSLIGITIVLQGGFMLNLFRKDDSWIIAFAGLLAVCSFAVAAFVLIRGITSYSSELSSRAGYLTFLTPNSTLKIVASKFLYTFCNALFAFAVFILLFTLDFSQMMKYFGEYDSLILTIKDTLTRFGVHLSEIAGVTLFSIAYTFLSLLCLVAIAYFAITLSYTLFRDKKWNWVPSLVFFVLIFWGVLKINGIFMEPIHQLTMVKVNPMGNSVATNVDAMRTVVIPALIPTSIVSLSVILLSLFSCSYMLEKKVNL